MPIPKAYVYFNSPIYVPDQGRYVLKLLETGGPKPFVEELERLSTLGSPWASAMLGYMALMPGSDGKRDASRAVELCKAHAYAGDSYAQFVFAWALIYSGQAKLAFDSMKKAAAAGFPPATIDFSTFIWNLQGRTKSDAIAALKALKFAYQARHASTLVWKYDFYRSGRLGFLRRPLGYLLAPLARLRSLFVFFEDPFSCRVFVFQHRATGPVLRKEPRLPFFRQFAKAFREENQKHARMVEAGLVEAGVVSNLDKWIMRHYGLVALLVMLLSIGGFGVLLWSAGGFHHEKSAVRMACENSGDQRNPDTGRCEKRIQP